MLHLQANFPLTNYTLQSPAATINQSLAKIRYFAKTAFFSHSILSSENQKTCQSRRHFSKRETRDVRAITMPKAATDASLIVVQISCSLARFSVCQRWKIKTSLNTPGMDPFQLDGVFWHVIFRWPTPERAFFVDLIVSDITVLKFNACAFNDFSMELVRSLRYVCFHRCFFCVVVPLFSTLCWSCASIYQFAGRLLCLQFCSIADSLEGVRVFVFHD